jgi:hypothetical protein
MSKKYYGLTYQRDSKEGTVVGVVANTFLKDSRQATPSEESELYAAIKDSSSPSLRDCLADGMYPNPISVWDTRAAARLAIADLNGYDSPHFVYRVLELGEKAERKLRPLLGWRIMYLDDHCSAWNTLDTDEERKEYPQIDLYNGEARVGERDPDARFLFTTRETGRRFLQDRELGDGYSLKAVYRE